MIPLAQFGAGAPIQSMIRQGLGAAQMPSRGGTTIQTGRPALPNPTIAMAPQRMMREEGGEVRKPHGPRVKFHVGPIHSSVAGRTDHLPMHVASGSYVLPADLVSGLGGGNTVAGFKVMRRVLYGTPYGQSGAPYGQGSGPYGEPLHREEGGETDGQEGVPIVAAGGEYVLSPGEVMHIGDGDLDLGHRVLDQFVIRMRKELVNTLSKLPGPKRD